MCESTVSEEKLFNLLRSEKVEKDLYNKYNLLIFRYIIDINQENVYVPYVYN